MQIQQESFLELMAKPDTRFVIPVFQRVYSWDARQCNELWEDIMAAGAQTDETAEPHFMGMLLYSADTETWHGTSMFDVIDGQRSMRTHMLWNVDTHMPRVRGPTSATRRSRISAAALFVNVMARISHGAVSVDSRMCAMR